MVLASTAIRAEPWTFKGPREPWGSRSRSLRHLVLSQNLPRLLKLGAKLGDFFVKP
jgi:hypothetical protein